MKNLTLITIIFCMGFSNYSLSQDYFLSQDCSIADYPFSGNADNIITDNLHGIANNPLLIDDRFGTSNSAYEFNGTSDYIELNDNQAVVNTQTFTITAWANMYGAGGGISQVSPIFIQRDNSATPGSVTSLIGLFAQYLDGNVAFLVRSNNPMNPTPVSVQSSSVNFNEWHFYAAVKDSFSITLYVDSVNVGTTSFNDTGDFNQSIDNVEIGRHYYGNTPRDLFNGSIDDVKIFNCALGETEIADVYNETITSLFPVDNTVELIDIYPNPTKASITIINKGNKKINLQLFTLTGKILNTYEVENNLIVDVSNLPNSTYFIKTYDDKHSKIYKFVKTK